jgi:hypothetical protein
MAKVSHHAGRPQVAGFTLPRPFHPISHFPRNFFFTVPQRAINAFLQSDVLVFENLPDSSEVSNLTDCLKHLPLEKKAIGLLPSKLMDRIRRCLRLHFYETLLKQTNYFICSFRCSPIGGSRGGPYGHIDSRIALHGIGDFPRGSGNEDNEWKRCPIRSLHDHVGKKQLKRSTVWGTAARPLPAISLRERRTSEENCLGYKEWGKLNSQFP